MRPFCHLGAIFQEVGHAMHAGRNGAVMCITFELPIIGTQSMLPVMLPITYFSGKEKASLDFDLHSEVVPSMSNLHSGPGLEGATPFNI